MAYGNQQFLSNLQKTGCALYCLFSIGLILYGLLFASMGHCVAEVDGSGCEHDRILKFIAFPGTLIVGIAGAVLLIRQMMKDRN